MPGCAGETRSQAADQVDGRVGRRSIERFAELAQIPKAPHVEGDVEQAAMFEDVGKQPPPFSRERERAHVCSPVHESAAGKVHNGGTRKHHPHEHCSIEAKDYLSDADGRFAAADPWPTDDWLWRIVGQFAALRGFVLQTPLAHLLAEGETGKLAATSNAVCHGLNKSVSGVGVTGRGAREINKKDVTSSEVSRQGIQFIGRQLHKYSGGCGF